MARREAGAYVAVVQVRFRLPAQTLKEKRTVIRSVVDRLRNQFNASVAETADLDTPELGCIAAACVSNSATHAEEQVQAIVEAIESWRLDIELFDVQREVMAL
jgi:hypothetical protein